jgi:hypothetical protein
MSDELVYVGTYPDTLADGRPVANGDAVHLTDKQRGEPHNKRLIDEHRLVARPQPQRKTTTKSEEVEGK